MPKVYFKKAARKDYPRFGIKRGQPYWEWAFYRQGLIKSPTRPTRSQLTQDEEKQTVWSFYDQNPLPVDPDEIRSAASDFESAAGTAQEKLDNLPEGLQQAPVGEALQTKISALESMERALGEIADRIESGELEDEDEIREEIAGTEEDME